MHCPRCGQQQISDETRFCKSCGFSLAAVRTLLTTDSVTPTREKESQKSQSPRRKGVRQGVILLFIFMVLLPLIELKGGSDLKFLPMMFLMAGLMRILYAAIFQEGAPAKTKQDNSLRHVVPGTIDHADARGAALPPARSVPVAASKTWRSTTELANRPSVTEHTTKLLSESQDSK